MSSEHPDAASMPSAREEGNARRITYSTEFLLSLAGSDACKKLPAGVDASAFSELNQATPLGTWDACSSGSSDHQGDLPQRELDQLDRYPGNQYRHNWHNTEHDGLLGSGAFPRPPCYVGPLAPNDRGSGYQLNRTSGRYQPPRLYKAVPISCKDVDSINDETFGSSECSNKDRVEEERKRRASFELARKEQHKALQEKKSAPDSDKENLNDCIICLLQNSAGKRGPPTRTDKQEELKASSCSKEDAIKTSPLLPTPKTRLLKPPGFANPLPEKRFQLQSSNTSLTSERMILWAHRDTRGKYFQKLCAQVDKKRENNQLKSRQLSTDDIMVSPVPESSKCAKWFPDEGSGHAEDLSSKNLLSMIVKDENLTLENMVRGPSASHGTFENLSPKSRSNCDSGSNLVHFISPIPAVGTLKKYSTDGIPESVPVMTCGDLEQTMLAHVNDISTSNQQHMVWKCQTVLDEPSAAEQIAVDQHASLRILSLLQKGTTSKDSSPLEFHMGPADKLLSSGPNAIVSGGTTASDPVSNTETILTSGKNTKLEGFFGAAFMNDLCSRDSPVSVGAHTAGGLNSSSKGLPFSEEGKAIPSIIPGDHQLGEQMVPLSHSKAGALHMKMGTGVEHGNTKFSGSCWEAASVDEKSLETQLPEEDNLLSVNDSLHAQNTHHLPFTESARADGLLQAKTVADLNYRSRILVPGETEHIQVIGHDVLGSCPRDWRDQVDPNNLYHLFGSSPPAVSPINSVSTMFRGMDHIANQNQHVPFSMPEAIHRGTRCFPQDMNSTQQFLPAPSGPRVDPVAHHRMLQHMSMPGSFPPQGLPREVPLSQPVHHMPSYRAETIKVNSFQMHLRQPGYGESRMMMAGPEVGVDRADAFERLIQMEIRARSKQIHPAMTSPVQGLYGPELNMNFRL